MDYFPTYADASLDEYPGESVPAGVGWSRAVVKTKTRGTRTDTHTHTHIGCAHNTSTDAQLHTSAHTTPPTTADSTDSATSAHTTTTTMETGNTGEEQPPRLCEKCHPNLISGVRVSGLKTVALIYHEKGCSKVPVHLGEYLGQRENRRVNVVCVGLSHAFLPLPFLFLPSLSLSPLPELA